MKFYPNQIEQILKKISNSEVGSILLYGPDKGIIQDIIEQITNLKKSSIKKVDYKEFINGNLKYIIAEQSLFGPDEIILVENISTNIKNINTDLIINKNQKLIIFVGDELPSKSSLRLFFEKSNINHIIACYPDNKISISNIVKNKLSKNNKSITIDALNLFTDLVEGDRSYIYNEIYKLELFTENKKIIDHDDVLKVVLDHKSASSLDMCYFFYTKKSINFFKEIDKLLQEQTPIMWIIRSLVRYILNIQSVLNSNQNQEFAIKSLRPPIFFKHISEFKQTINYIPKENIPKILEILFEAEKNAKNSIKDNIIIYNCYYNYSKLRK